MKSVSIRETLCSTVFSQNNAFVFKHARRLKEKIRKKFGKKSEQDSQEPENTHEQSSIPEGAKVPKNE